MKTACTLFCLLLLLLLSAPQHLALAQTDVAASNPVVMSLKGMHEMTSGTLMKAAEMLDEDMYAYRPTDDVRTTGQILAHVANAQYMICSTAAGEASPNSVDFEKTATTKADIVAALAGATAYCSGVYEGMTDADGAQIRELFGMQMAASAMLAFNTTHNYEHYGNLVTYMRMNDIVPPSSQQ